MWVMDELLVTSGPDGEDLALLTFWPQLEDVSEEDVAVADFFYGSVSLDEPLPGYDSAPYVLTFETIALAFTTAEDALEVLQTLVIQVEDHLARKAVEAFL